MKNRNLMAITPAELPYLLFKNNFPHRSLGLKLPACRKVASLTGGGYLYSQRPCGRAGESGQDGERREVRKRAGQLGVAGLASEDHYKPGQLVETRRGEPEQSH